MLDQVNDHLAVVVRKDVVAVFGQEDLEFVGIADIAVVSSDHMDKAVHIMRLGVDVGNRAVCRPTYLTDELEAGFLVHLKLLDDL